MRVLVVTTNGIINDGITAWIRQTFGAMNPQGIEVCVVTQLGNDSELISAVNRVVHETVTLPSRQKSPIAYIKAFNKLISKENFDIVHLCGASSLMSIELAVAKRHGIPVRIAHSHNTTCSHRLVDRCLRHLLYASSTHYLACGESAGRWLFGDRCFHIAKNGRDLNLFRFDSAQRGITRSMLGIVDDEILFGHVGRFNDQKNQTRVVEIFAQLKKNIEKCKLCFIGDGPKQQLVEERVRELKLEASVIFLGRRPDVPSLLNGMDCMLLPSLFEGFPNVMIEWQTNGLPSVVSDIVPRECSFTDLVRFLPLGDSNEAWTRCVLQLIDDRDRVFDSQNGFDTAYQLGLDSKTTATELKAFYVAALSE